MLTTFMNSLRQNLGLLFLIGNVSLWAYNSYMLNTINTRLTADIVRINTNISTINTGIDGKLKDIESSYKNLAEIKTASTTEKEIIYIEKNAPDDADIELNQEKPKVTVKVNEGPVYSFDTLATETSKFENGKLVIKSAYTTDINITSDKYNKSRWSATGAINADKNLLGSISYDLTDSLALTVTAGQGIKPYYGMTFRIGSFN